MQRGMLRGSMDQGHPSTRKKNATEAAGAGHIAIGLVRAGQWAMVSKPESVLSMIRNQCNVLAVHVIAACNEVELSAEASC